MEMKTRTKKKARRQRRNEIKAKNQTEAQQKKCEKSKECEKNKRRKRRKIINRQNQPTTNKANNVKGKKRNSFFKLSCSFIHTCPLLLTCASVHIGSTCFPFFNSHILANCSPQFDRIANSCWHRSVRRKFSRLSLRFFLSLRLSLPISRPPLLPSLLFPPLHLHLRLRLVRRRLSSLSLRFFLSLFIFCSIFSLHLLGPLFDFPLPPYNWQISWCRDLRESENARKRERTKRNGNEYGECRSASESSGCDCVHFGLICYFSFLFGFHFASIWFAIFLEHVCLPCALLVADNFSISFCLFLFCQLW